MTKFAFLLVMLCCLAKTTFSMEISEKYGRMHMKGEIKQGDSEKLLQIINSFKESWQDVRIISLNSMGGDAIEALKIAEIIEHLYTDVYVDKEGGCASACFFLYLAGDNRSAKGMPKASSGIRNWLSGPVGLHRPYIRSSSIASNFRDEQKTAMRKIARYLEDKHVPRRLVDEMMSRSSVDVYWLQPNDLREIGKYPPESEELYLARCGRSTDARYEVTVPETDPNWIFHQLRYSKCIDEQRDGLRKDWLTKMKNGWRPTNPLDAIQ